MPTPTKAPAKGAKKTTTKPPQARTKKARTMTFSPDVDAELERRLALSRGERPMSHIAEEALRIGLGLVTGAHLGAAGFRCPPARERLVAFLAERNLGPAGDEPEDIAVRLLSAPAHDGGAPAWNLTMAAIERLQAAIDTLPAAVAALFPEPASGSVPPVAFCDACHVLGLPGPCARPRCAGTCVQRPAVPVAPSSVPAGLPPGGRWVDPIDPVAAPADLDQRPGRPGGRR